jgi:hypothetical protein
MRFSLVFLIHQKFMKHFVPIKRNTQMEICDWLELISYVLLVTSYL